MIGKLWNPFDCDRMCREQGGRWLVGERQSRACTRTDLPQVEPDVDVERLRFYVGRYPDRELDGVLGPNDGTWERPVEDDDSGCPGGYQRCRLVWGVMRFYRRRVEGGGRVPNPLFDRLDDELVIEAVLHLEREEERAACERERVWAELREQQRDR